MAQHIVKQVPYSEVVKRATYAKELADKINIKITELDAIKIDLAILKHKGTIGVIYTLSDDGAYYSVTSYGDASDANVVLIDEIYNIVVSQIGDEAFRGCESLVSITIPSSVTKIHSGAFAGCSNLTDIYVPWAEGEVADAPWGAQATIHYNYVG